MSSSEISDILSEFSSSIDLGISTMNRTGSVRLRNFGGSGEGRKQIPSHYLESVTSHTSLTEAAGLFSSGTLFDDIIDPPDLEQEIELQIQSMSTEDAQRNDFIDFPPDDVDVIDEERQYRTVQPALPPNSDLEQSSLLNSCLESFTQNHCIVKRNYEMYGSNRADRSGLNELEKQLSRPAYDGDEDNENAADSAGDNNTKLQGKESSGPGVDLKHYPADPLLDNLFKFIPQEKVDETNAKLRTENRSSNLFGLFSLTQSSQEQPIGGFDDPEFPIENLQRPPPPAEHFGHRLLVKCLCLELEVEIEPIFASIALYDAKARKKISENFYFELNSDALRKMVRNKDVQPSLFSLARTAIFSLTYPSHDVFIVIKLEKVLQQGDASMEAYSADAPEKVLEKAKQNAKWFCDRLGRYRMPFAWTAIHLMNVVNSARNLQPMEETVTNAQNNGGDPGSRSSTLEMKQASVKRRSSLSEGELMMLSSFKPVTLTVGSFFKQETEKLKDEDLFKFLIDLKRPTNVLKKLKCIPGKMKIDISPCSVEFPYCITPDLYRVKPFPDQRGRPTREIQEFAPYGVNVPNTTYRNLLYVYPQAVNFTNRPGHFRNIAVKVQLLDCEEICNALPLIYGKSCAPEFVSEAYTSVIYHNKNPDFYEEIKLQLPTKLTPRHHLLFSFYHISCQRKQDLSPIETPIGYTWLSLLHSGRLRTGEVWLPVSTEKLPPHYSLNSPENLHSPVKWVDGQRPVFCVQLHTVSTVHPLDKNFDRFFSLVEHLDKPRNNGVPPFKLPDGSPVGDIEAELRKSLFHLSRESSLHSLVRFFYVVINKITELLVSPPVINGEFVNMGEACFEAIVYIVLRFHQSDDLLCDSHQRNVLLATYARYIFTIPPFKAPTSPRPTSPGPGIAAGSHYATMTRSEKRSRPPISKATFHISNSNPNLASPDEPTSYDDSVFFRQSATRSSMSEHTSKTLPDATQVRSVSHKLFHEEMVLLFYVSSGKDVALQHAWFILELISKSMAIHLHQSGMLSAPRSNRFPRRFLDDLERVVKMISHEVTTRCAKNYDFAERLNCALAFFLNDLLSIMDRGFVLRMVRLYCQMVTTRIRTLYAGSPSSLIILRVNFLRIICSHEHYVTLNLPFASLSPPSPTPSISSTTSSFVSGVGSHIPPQYDLSDQFMATHFLAGLLLTDIRLCIELTESGQFSMHKPMLFILTALRQLMTAHDCDPRLNKRPQMKRLVASLYVPLVPIAVRALQYAYLFSGSDKNPALTDEGAVSSSVASAIASPATTGAVDNSFMGPESTRNLLICFLWLLKNTERPKLKSWWSCFSANHLIALVDLLYISVSCFEFGGKSNFGREEVTRSSINRSTRAKDSKSRLQEAILGGSSARQELLMRRKGDRSATIAGAGSREGLRWRKDQTEWKQARFGDKRRMEEDSNAVRNLSAEVVFIVLDTLDVIVETTTEMEGSNTSQVLSSSLRILLHILSKRQSVEVLQHSFAIQRSIVAKFPELIFEEETDQCADLSLRLLERCTSSSMKIRMQAAASLYMLMRHNFSMGNNFAQVKMQVTMSMSSLVGVSHDFDEEHLRRSLKTILSYAETDTELEETTFPAQVRDLILNLHMILSDTVKMKEHQEDPEMLIDLMYRIAKGYQNSPDLRLTWLQNMAKQHSERKNHAEAGMCLLHCAALVSEYLSMVEPSSYLPVGCVAFQKISFNILEESVVSDDVVSPNADALRTEKYFSVPGFIGLMEQAAQTFSLAGLHEVVAMVYDILSPTYSHQKDYKKLSDIHSKLSESFTKISSQAGKRMFGTYFRVAFYGLRFGDLNGEEFIYKEPAITKLPEISHRLEGFYGQCFGDDKVEVIKDSSSIDPNSLDPDKAYIQITYVDPYFYEYENDEKVSYFDRNFGINKFMYATPFTKIGKAHGEMKEQYKRKTFLQVSHTFPYVKTRVNVVKRWETVLTPLESACEDVKKKTSDLHKAVNLQPPDVRMLQVNLQGAVLTSVNQGPMEIANTFLAEIPDEPTKYLPYNELRISFKKFIYACSVALKKNRSLISADQKDYHREMEKNYAEMAKRMKQIDQGPRIVALIREQSLA